MSTSTRAGLRPMLPRDPREPHRTASTLELFFDLTFVVAVSVSAAQLLKAEEEGVLLSILRFLVVFFTIWWPWVNFTWFASAFDTDDWLYRVLTIVQMGGVLVIAAGVPTIFEHGTFVVPTIGYVVMRLALVAQWLRASRAPEFRATALRYAAGVATVQAGWVVSLFLPEVGRTALLVPLIAAELLVPVWAERPRVTPFHRHHIAERYGLFTLIVIGEGLLTVTNALLDAQASVRAGELVLLGATALVIIAAMWWIYFSRRAPVFDTDFRGTFAFGYLHYLVFGGAAAVAAGVELAIADLHPHGAEEAGGHGAEEVALGAEAPLVHLATTLPLAIYLLATWAVVLRPRLGRRAAAAVPLLAVAVGLAALLPFSLQIAAVLVVAVVAVLEVDARRTGAPDAG